MSPDLLTAARNAWAISPLGGGVEPDHATHATVVYDDPHARVERIDGSFLRPGDPVLLVTPLAVSASCWDLRPGQSLAAHLAGSRPTYTIDYGRITFADRGMGFEDWVGDILPTAVRRISAEHAGRPVHLVGWSHGGTMSLLLAAHDPQLPIASIVALGTPSDYSLMPTYASIRWFAENVSTTALTAPTALLGGTSALLTQLGYRALAPLREVTKPWSLLTNLHRPEVLGRIEAVDRFIASMPGYPARFFNQSLTRLVLANDLMTGSVRLRDDFVVDMHRLTTPTMLIGSTEDVLAHAAAVEAGVRAYPSADVEFVRVTGLSHLGLIASPRSHELTWPHVDRHLAAYDGLAGSFPAVG